MAEETENERRFAKYEQILNIIFGAAFGALGSVTLQDSELSLTWFAVAIYLIALAIPSVWAIAAFATVSKCVATSRPVKTVIYFVILVGLAAACVAINICTEVASAWGVVARGPELSAILAAWAVTYLITGFWVRVQRRLA